MTTQAELLQLAEANRASQPAIDAVLQSIQQEQIIARVALGAMESIVKGRREGVDFQDGYSVMVDNSDVVATAAKAATAMTLMATNLTTLAILLQQAGLDISY